MAGYKAPDLNERLAAANAAKQRALELLRNKPAPDPAVVAERQAAREARDAAAAERREARRLAAEAAKAAKATPVTQSDAADISVPAKQPDQVVRSDAELKAARDARYAARKARKR
jgi:hypothetical protein